MKLIVEVLCACLILVAATVEQARAEEAGLPITDEKTTEEKTSEEQTEQPTEEVSEISAPVAVTDTAGESGAGKEKKKTFWQKMWEEPKPAEPKDHTILGAYLQTFNIGADEEKLTTYPAEAIIYEDKVLMPELKFRAWIIATFAGLDFVDLSEWDPGFWTASGVTVGLRNNYVTITHFYKGQRRDDLTYFSSYVGTFVKLGYNPTGDLRLYYNSTMRSVFFERKKTTADDFVMPSAYMLWVSRFNLEYGKIKVEDNFELSSGLRLRLTGELEHRSNRDNNTLSRSDEVERSFSPSVYLIGQAHFLLPYKINLTFDLKARYSESADYISTSKIGTYLGLGDESYFLAGGGWGEFRSGQYALVNAFMGFDLWPRARGHVFIDQAILKRWLPFDDREPIIGLSGFGLGIRQNLFFGLPLWLRYGYCPQCGEGRGGHEFFLRTAIAFGY